jgi:hypothetical protein
VIEKTDSIVIGKSENSVVVHDGVHILYPNGVDVSIVDEPTILGLVFVEVLVDLLEDLRE